jgi:DNA-binding transcriptional LysR family regulator
MHKCITMTVGDWDKLRLFLVVARARSFNAAAQRTDIDQSTISRRMISLERDLGLTLFNRSARGSFLTPVGEAISQLAVDIEAKVKHIDARAAEELGLSGKIRLWTSEGIGGYWLPPRMKEFHHRYPGVTIEVLSSAEAPTFGDGEVDVTFSWHEPKNQDAVILSKGMMTLKPCASKAYLMANGIPKTLDDLKHHKICNHLHYPHNGEWKIWSNLVGNHPQLSYTTNSSWALGEVTLNGIGISLQPVGVEAREPTLEILDLEGYAPKLEFWLSCPGKIKDVPRIRALIEYIKSEFFLNPMIGSVFMPE